MHKKGNASLSPMSGGRDVLDEMIDYDIERLIDTDTVKLFKDGALTDVDASVVNECHFAIFLNDSYYSNNKRKKAFVDAMNGKCLVFTDTVPQYLKELAIGYCYCNADFEPENISDVVMADADEESVVAIVFVDGLLVTPKNGYVNHQVAFNTNTNRNIALPGQKLVREMKAFKERLPMHQITGSSGAAEIYDGEAVIRYIEDLDRTNAIYKAIGYSLTYGIDLSGCAMLTTGSLKKENVRACYLAGCHMIVSETAPTRQAIEYAMEKDVTLISFTGEDSYKVYHGWERIIL